MTSHEQLKAKPRRETERRYTTIGTIASRHNTALYDVANRFNNSRPIGVVKAGVLIRKEKTQHRITLQKNKNNKPETQAIHILSFK